MKKVKLNDQYFIDHSVSLRDLRDVVGEVVEMPTPPLTSARVRFPNRSEIYSISWKYLEVVQTVEDESYGSDWVKATLMVNKKTGEIHALNDVSVEGMRIIKERRCSKCGGSFPRGVSFIHGGNSFCGSCIKEVDPHASLTRSC